MSVTSSKSSGKRDRNVPGFLRLFVFSLLAVTCASSAAFAQLPTPISQCGTVITQPGTYTVANDLSCFFQDGIDIVADHVILMLNSHQISAFSVFGFFGNGISVGIGVPSGNSHVSVLGPGTITGFNAGINFEQVSHSSVRDVTSTSNFFGIVVNGGFAAGCNQSCPSTKNVFQGNTSTFNDQHGFTMNGANDNTFRDNNASNNFNGNGLLLFTASGNDVNGNTATGNGDSGIAVSSGTGMNNTIKNNTAQNNTNFDLNDGNTNCDSNSWKNNIFGSSNQSCIQ
jgi:parallel beta-helix repeat protein